MLVNESTPFLLLATGSGVNLALEPIYSSAVWGAGWWNAPAHAHYADNVIRYEGNIDFELEGSNNYWNFVRKWCLDQRAYSKSMHISPDGTRIYQYDRTGAPADDLLKGAFCSSMSFSTSAGNFVTCTANMMAIYRTELNPAGGVDSYGNYSYLNQIFGVYGGMISGNVPTFVNTNPLNPNGYNINPIPYWRTLATLGRITGSYTPFAANPSFMNNVDSVTVQVVDWNISLTNNTTILYTASGVRQATAILQGVADSTASATFFHPSGVYDPILGDGSGTYTADNPYLYAANSVFQIEITRPTAAGAAVYLEVPAPVIESDDYSIKGQSDVTTRGYSMHGLGGRTATVSGGTVVIPSLIISDETGALAGPSAP